MSTNKYDQIRSLLDQAWALANDRQYDWEISTDWNSPYLQLDRLLNAINNASLCLDDARSAFNLLADADQQETIL